MNRRQRTILLTFAFWSVVLAASGVWLRRTERQERLNRQLIAAIKQEDISTALLALEQGADANSRDEPVVPALERIQNLMVGRKPLPSTAPTPLLILLWYDFSLHDNDIPPEKPPHEHSALVEALLAHGANVNPYDDARQCPLLYALADKKKIATARLLIEHGANISDGPASDYLYEAVDWGDDPSIIELLLKHGANPNRERSKGVSPLSIALYHRNCAAVACLVSNHADPNLLALNWGAKNTRAMGYIRPLEYAEQNHMPEIANLLRAADGRVRK